MRAEHFKGSTNRQNGVVTLAVGLLLLLLITIVTLYGARVGLLEQRISANDYRAKLAHGASEAGRNNAIEFLNSNLPLFNLDGTYTRQDGSTVQGWLSAGNNRWGDPVVLDCANPGSAHQAAACDSGMTGTVFFYDGSPDADPSDDTDFDVFDMNDLSADRVTNLNQGRLGDELRVSYNADFIICPLDLDTTTTPPVVQDPPCVGDIEDSKYYAVLVRSEGFIIGDPDGNGMQRLDNEAVAQSNEIVIKYDIFGAGPRSPLTVANTFSAGGTFDIVANPNGGPGTAGGGRSGAPFSVWSGSTYNIGGATVTCQRYEFFATDPGDNEMYSATPPNDIYEVCYQCQCPDKQTQQFHYLSSDVKGKGIDIVEDPDFPPDLFLYTFGVPRDSYELLKDLAVKIPSAEYATCDSLEPGDTGFFWSDGVCEITDDVGTPHNPVLLVSEGEVRLNGGAIFFGVIYVFSNPDSDQSPNLTMNGGSQVYGAVVGDSSGAGAGAGNNVIIFDQSVLDRVSLSPELQRVSPLPGTWTDRAP